MVSLALMLVSFSDSKTTGLSQISELLSLKSKRPAIVVSAGAGEFAVDLGVANPDLFVDPIVKLGSVLMQSDMSVLRPTILPAANWGVLKGMVDAPALGRVLVEDVPGEAVKTGKLFFASKPYSTISLKSISLLKFEKKIQVAGYFEGAQESPFKIAVSAKEGVAGVVFAQSLATGLGGKFRVTDKVWFIDFDAQAWRRGFSTLLSKAQAGSKSESVARTPGRFETDDNGEPVAQSFAQTSETKALALSLLNQTVSSLSDQLVEQTFAFPNTVTRLNLNNYPSLKKYIGDFIRSVSAKATAGATVSRPGQGGITLPANLLQRIDPNRPGELVIQTDFRLSVELNLAGPSGGDSREPFKIQIL